MSAYVCLPLLLLLAGCADVQGVYARYQDGEEIKYIEQAKVACTRYGFTSGTDAFAGCVDKNVNAAKDRDAQKAAALMGKPEK